jgi:3-hydroxyisobutyrate dehydrogenase
MTGEVGGADGPNTEKLGYLGLRMMGFPMARRLVSAGHGLTVWNRFPGRAPLSWKLARNPRLVRASW